MEINLKKIKKMAAKETISQAKKELLKIKEKGNKVDVEEFEEYVKFLYEKILNEIIKKNKIKITDLENQNGKTI